MPANYTRRHDLFLDAGFSAPQDAIASLRADAQALGLLHQPDAPIAIDQALNLAAPWADAQLDAPLRALLDLAPEWLRSRSGDLASLFWMARGMSADAATLPLGALTFGLAARLWRTGQQREAAALVRFLIDLDFDYGALYQQSDIAYGFFQPRDPNPLVWKLLELVEGRAAQLGARAASDLHALELGCGIGNDALGLMSHPRVSSYTGVDLSQLALDRHHERVQPALQERDGLKHDLVRGDFVRALEDLLDKPADQRQPVNLVYAYSSLHYFSSSELRHIFSLVHKLLPPGKGMLCFGIKGEGSIWDGQGLPLYRPDVWINLDGQTRWFPSRQALAQMLDQYGFELLMHELAEHWGYSERGKRDVFHYVVCTPRA